MNKWMIVLCLFILILLGAAVLAFLPSGTAHAPTTEPTNFAECEAAGYPIDESYPRQCTTPDGSRFVEEVTAPAETYTTTRGNTDIIRLINPQPGQKITSPLTVAGEARGMWFFEASFPVVLTNWDGLIIAQGIAQAQGEWMTEEYVPFEATLTFETPTAGDPAVNRGSLILQKDNPSGLPEHDDALEIQVVY